MSADGEENWRRLSELVAGVMDRKGIPGVAVGILHGGETATAGFGVTSVDHPLPVTDETLFQIGSITKTFTATAIMRLVESGELDMDATVRTYLPDFKMSDETAASQVTVRHLLTHVSGWAGDYFDDTGSGDDALAKYVANMADLEQLAPLGAVWSYNNAGFSLAGHIIEVVTGSAYEAALTELVLEPLGLRSCFFSPGQIMTHRFAVGHKLDDDGAQVARPWPLPRAARPAGGIVTHVQDLLSYARFHLGDGRASNGTRLLTSGSLTEMHSPQVMVWGTEAWGLSWRIDQVGGVAQVSHGGGTLGQISLLALLPERDFAIVILTNADRGSFVVREVSRWALKHYLGLEVADPIRMESSEEELISYVGRYRRPFSDIELGILGGRLVAQIIPKGSFPTKDSPPPPRPPPTSLAFCEKDRLMVLDGPGKDAKVDVVRREDGSIGWLRSGGRIHMRDT